MNSDNAPLALSAPTAPTPVNQADQGAAAATSNPRAPAKPPFPTNSARTTPGASGGDIVVQARRNPPGDPLQAINAKSYAVTQDVDRAVIGPVALAYKHAIPSPIRDGFRNFSNNLHGPVVLLNYLLQLKPGKAGETFGRFAINSTIGVAGLFDRAKRRPFNLPRRPNGLADTLGYYGVKPGPFFFLPVIGPTTLRDLIGGGVDRLVLPLAVGKPFTSSGYNIPTGLVKTLDRRAEFDDQLNKLRGGTVDPYTARRELYLQIRQAEIDSLRAPPKPG